MKSIKKQLEELAVALKKIEPDSPEYDVLMAKLDKILSIKNTESNPELDAEWERKRDS
jgi:hypothetical protein